jgi:hypothetical protein
MRSTKKHSVGTSAESSVIRLNIEVIAIKLARYAHLVTPTDPRIVIAILNMSKADKIYFSCTCIEKRKNERHTAVCANINCTRVGLSQSKSSEGAHMTSVNTVVICS